ncbi:hypothetical protein D3C71_584040 [compost metagenome]
MRSAYFLILAFVLFASKSFADCAGTGLYVFPSQKEIRTNNLFLLEGYAQSQHIIAGLNKEFPIYLKSGTEIIKLEVTEVNTGQFYITQALLKPEKSLTLGKEYMLVIDHLPEHEYFGNYNQKTQKYDPISYLVNLPDDVTSPKLTDLPTEKSKSLAHFGCGPSIHVEFGFNVSDDSPVFVRTTVKSKENGTTTTYLLVHSGQGVSIGHGMCSGAFGFGHEDEYEVQFELLDNSGNAANSKSEWISFTKPTDENSR